MISNNEGELIDVRKSISYNVSDARDDGADNQHGEVGTSGASFVAFKEAALDKKEIPEEHVSKSTQVVGDLNQELSISAIALQPVLEHLRPGWNKISPHVFAITTTVPENVDTTLCPSGELMWLRTTLVKFRDGWRLLEFCKQFRALQTSTEKLHVGEEIQGGLTLAYVYAIPPEQLGFNVDPANLPPLAQQVEQPADEIEVEAEEREVPVDIEIGEAAPEDQLVEAPVEHDAAIVDGVSLSLSSSLANIRLGCESLGLSKRGGKEKGLKRMLEHVRAQELIAATSATVKIQRENARVPAEQPRPVVPSQSMIDEHALTHYPYADWCETCVMHKARQDAHVVQEHDRKQHSIISFDFGCASRTEGDKLTVLFINDQFTKLMGAIPTPQKGGKSLNYIVTR